MQANGVQMVTKADAKFVSRRQGKDRVNKLEQAWIADAEGQGPEEPGQGLAEFRAEIAKLQK
jgi:hypothetical protein